MPTLNIEGRKVSVGEEFLKLSPEQQNATVDEIAKSLPRGGAAEPKGALAQAVEPITSYLPTQRKMAQEGVDLVGRGVDQLVSGAKTAVSPTPEGMSPADQAGAGPLSIIKGAGNVALGGVLYATSPISAAYRTFLGQPVENITGIPKEYTEFGAALATPGLGLTRLPKGPPAIIKPPVPLTAGEEVAAAGQRIGVDVPRAATTESPAVQQIAKGATSIPGVGTPLREASEAAIADLGTAAQNARAGFGSGSPAAAGAGAREGLTEALRNGPIKQRVGELYDRVDGFVNPVVTGELPNTRNLVNTIDARRVNAALPQSSVTNELGEALSRKGMNYEGIKDLRTYFGEMQDGNIPIPQGMTGGEVKQIYGALSQDMRLIIAKAGGTDGLRAFEQANRAAARWAGIREDLGGILNLKSEEAIFDKIAAMAGSSARADINLLGRVRGAVGPQHWDEVSSAVIGKMGWPPGGTGFSPDQFLTAYKKMSEEGRRLLFRSTNNASHADAIDDIAKVSERFKQLNKYGNPSGTAQHSALFAGGAAATATTAAVLAGHFIEPLTTVTAIVGGRIASHILARPMPARAMARWAEDYAAVAANPTPASMNKLEASTKIFAASVGKDFGRPDLVNEFMRRLQGAMPAAADNEQTHAPGVIEE